MFDPLNGVSWPFTPTWDIVALEVTSVVPAKNWSCRKLAPSVVLGIFNVILLYSVFVVVAVVVVVGVGVVDVLGLAVTAAMTIINMTRTTSPTIIAFFEIAISILLVYFGLLNTEISI
jgi:hypothetical protein